MKFVLLHLLLSLAGSSAVYFGIGPISGWSFLAGALLSLINFGLLFFLLRQIFEKKHVALSSASIVFKYAILGLIIYLAITLTSMDVLWFGVGLGSLSLTFIFRGRDLSYDRRS